MVKVEGTTVTVKYVKSVIKQPKRTKQIIEALGFRKLNQVITRPNNPAILGMLRKVAHLVAIQK